MKVVSPHSTLAMATGLGQSGSTAAQGKLWRREEQEDQDMHTEQTEGMADGSADREMEAEEAEVPRTRRAPKGPRQKARAEHEATHIPYRDWCRRCVRGRAKNSPH